jgi:DNA-binding NarL/FixJ family response regulator
MQFRILTVFPARLDNEGLASLLKDEEDFQMLPPVSNYQDAIDSIKNNQPDVMLIDSEMYIGCCSFISENNGLNRNTIKIVTITNKLSKSLITILMRLGVQGALSRNSSAVELKTALRSVMEDSMYICQEIQSIIAADYVNLLNKNESTKDVLSQKELSILKMIAEGFTSKEMASLFNLSTKTIDVYRFRIRKKLNIYSDAELTTFALKEGLLTL